MATKTGPAVLQVHIFRDGEFLGTDVFSERQIVVGRDPDESDLVLESSQVSRKHAIIENDNGKLSVRDAGSTNGLFVNADKVEGIVEVTRLDEIRIGDFSLKLKLAGKGKNDGPTKSGEDSTRTTGSVMPEAQTPVAPSRVEPSGVEPSHVEPSRIEQLRSEPSARVEPRRLQQQRVQPQGVEPSRNDSREAFTERRPEIVSEQPRHELAHAKPNHDLSEFDDLVDEPTNTAARSPSAEFRKRSEPVGRDKLGDMLADLGINGASATADHGVGTPTRIDKAYQRPVDLAGELEGSDFTAPDNVYLADDEDSVTGTLNGVSNGRHYAGAAPLSRHEPDAESLTSGSPANARGVPKAPDIFGLDSDPMSAMEPHADLTHDDDDHDDDYDFEPDYSLAEHILGEELPPKNGVARIEVLGIRSDLVESVTMLAPGESFWVGPEASVAKMMTKSAKKDGGANYVPGERYELVKHKKPGEVEIEFKKEARGMIVRGGRSIDLAQVGAKANKRQERRGTQMMGLSRGEIAQVADGPITYHVRHVIAPAPLRDSRSLLLRMRPERLLLISAASAFFGHIFALVFFSIVNGHPPEAKDHAKEEFVEVTLEPEMKLEEPPPKPPEPEPTPPAKPEPVAEQKPIPQKVPKNVKLPKVANTPPPPNPAPVGVLGLLNKTGATQAPGPAAAVAAISNLAAAKTPSGSSGYKVSGLIGKLPTSELAIGGGGGGPMTKGAAALLRGGGGGAGAITGKVGGKVGGLVTKLPGQMRAAGGSLDREEIQKVVNKHVGEIQRCYERELLKTPGLSGKVTVEWVVAMTGSVKSTRQKDSTLQSAAAVNCILSSVKSWQFPTPKGGEVVVSYPFNFSQIAM
ncbi:MAG: AgmX/PglI C-terminal domain-containing protein [Clostridia bacterium]|nr:AgmX/PglI C-terminal domain-containing protein [Deltaproteobacteria bacterium]